MRIDGVGVSKGSWRVGVGILVGVGVAVTTGGIFGMLMAVLDLGPVDVVVLMLRLVQSHVGPGRSRRTSDQW